MKKICAVLLAVTMLASMATVVSAAESTTTLTTTVPAATYTLNIPADQEIAFGATSTNIGEVSITNAESFAVGKNIAVTFSYSAFVSSAVETTIPFAIKMVNSERDGYKKTVASNESIVFKGQQDGTVAKYTNEIFSNMHVSSGKESIDLEDCYVLVDSVDWGKALAGEYTATITFTAEVVVEQ